MTLLSRRALNHATRSRGAATLTIRTFGQLSTQDKATVTREGGGLLDFAAPGDTHDIQFTPAGR